MEEKTEDLLCIRSSIRIRFKKKIEKKSLFSRVSDMRDVCIIGYL